MRMIDPGHQYALDVYDGRAGEGQVLTFMKREGHGYPGNRGHYPGTNCQEVLRVLINRIQYLDNQIESPNNAVIVANLREAIWLLEDRAAERHGLSSLNVSVRGIEAIPTCPTCGHIECKGHTK